MNHTVERSGERAGISGADLAASSPAPYAGDSHTRALHAAERNRLLHGLSIAAYEQLAPHLEPTDLTAGQVLWEPDELIRVVYFPRTAVCSLVTPLSDEAPVESATVGCEGMVGAPVVLGAPVTHTRAITQIAGAAARVDAARFRDWLWEAEGALPFFLRYAQALIEQTAQSVACNRRHEAAERCARWLLTTRDRVGSDQFALPHQLLAAMLGVRRAGVTVAAGMLQRAGFISYARGRVTVLDAERLEEASCECYRVVRTRQERLLGRSPA